MWSRLLETNVFGSLNLPSIIIRNIIIMSIMIMIVIIIVIIISSSISCCFLSLFLILYWCAHLSPSFQSIGSAAGLKALSSVSATGTSQH